MSLSLPKLSSKERYECTFASHICNMIFLQEGQDIQHALSMLQSESVRC